MTYIHTPTGQYPVTEADIRAANPQTSFPAIFTPPEGYEVVFPAPRPAYNAITHGVRESAPVLTDKGHYEQRWEVYALEPAQVAANQAAAVVALQAVVTQDIQTMLDAKSKEYEYDTIHTANGWASEFPEAAALKAWGAACWTKSKEIRLAVQAGTRPMPTSAAEVLAEMPVFVAPV